ncbi:MAG: endonuclease III [Syntrophomonadaceae bacterium]|nr:endonuclease III [Syntrophomonadaceae bacterium]
MIMQEKERVRKIIELLKKEYPDAKTRLHFSNRLELLVAVVLSAQSTDEQVNKVTPELFSWFSSAQELEAMDIEELEELIRGVGLYKNKARHIKGLAQKIAADYAGEVPGTFDELLKLPGVGRKSANVMLSVGFDQPGLGVDTHVKRVARRLGISTAKNTTQIEKDLKQVIPVSLWSDSHHLLIAHGRAVCQARKPKCGDCILAALCHRCEV